MNPRRRLIITLLAVAVAVIGIQVAVRLDLISPRAIVASLVPAKASLPTTGDLQTAPSRPAVPLPTTKVVSTGCTKIRMEVWAWNAQMGMMFANGGETTTDGSLMRSKGVCLTFARQDDPTQMQNDLVAFAKQYADGAEPSIGTHYVTIMGDGAAAFLAGVNGELKKLGPDSIAEVIGALGYSRGEDGFWGPAAWRKDPKAAMGGLVAGVLRDGDWNIAMIWLANNQLPNNPDEKTWDAEALNWVNAETYIDAAQKYVANYCEDRTVVKKGKLTGEKKKVCVNAVVTWTPGDVILAKNRGGLVPILTTRENSRQMPAVVIGIRKWNRDHRPAVEGMLAAAFDGAEQVAGYPAALQRAAEISAAVYKEKNAGPDYWLRYYKGVTEPDALGAPVRLGGSKVSNLSDNLQIFGLLPGSGNLFAATYKTFGDIVVQQYPKLVPSYPPAEEITNTSFVQALASRAPTMVASSEALAFTSAPIAEQVGRKAWAIQFESGKATFTPDALGVLNTLYDQLLVAGGLAVEIHGHTDNAGGTEFNQTLSERRAFAVKRWLEEKSGANFPEGRLRVFSHGLTAPVADNSTDAGRAKNRRVEIVLGQ